VEVLPSAPRLAAPLLLLPARTLFFIAGQAVVAWILRASGDPDPGRSAAGWWPVSAIAGNLACLGLMLELIRREHIGLRSLMNPDPGKWREDLRTASWLLIPAILLGAGGVLLAGRLAYGTASMPPMLGPLPWWAAVLTAGVFPAVNAFVEQTVYLGYALPRLRDGLRSTVGACTFVGFWWGLQHAALPFYPDPKFALMRSLAFTPLFVVFIPPYLRLRRLAPFIAVHWILDTAGMASLLALR